MEAVLASKEQKILWEGMKNHDFNAHSTAAAVTRLSRKYIGKNVLDAGAGDGTLERELQHGYSCRCTSIDIAPADDSVTQGDIMNLNYSDCTFDTVFCLDVLEHLTFAQSAKAVDEMGRVLKNNGHLIITSPYEEDLESNTLTCPHCQKEFHKSGHQLSMDLARLDILLMGFFETVKVKICNLGFMQLFGFPVDLFYRWGLEKIFKHKLLTKNIFVVAKKL